MKVALFRVKIFSAEIFTAEIFTAEPSLRNLHCGAFTANSHCGSPARKLSFSASIHFISLGKLEAVNLSCNGMVAVIPNNSPDIPNDYYGAKGPPRYDLYARLTHLLCHQGLPLHPMLVET